MLSYKMAQTTSDEDIIDLGALAALTRSTQSLDNKSGDETVDIKALVAAADEKLKLENAESSSVDLKAMLAMPEATTPAIANETAKTSDAKKSVADPFATNAKSKTASSVAPAKKGPDATTKSTKAVATTVQTEPAPSKAPWFIGAAIVAALGAYFVLKPAVDTQTVDAEPSIAPSTFAMQANTAVNTAVVEASPAIAATVPENPAQTAPAVIAHDEPTRERAVVPPTERANPRTEAAPPRPAPTTVATRVPTPAAAAPEPAARRAPEATPAAQPSAANLLDQAFGRPAATPVAAPAPATLPDTPSQGDVRRVIGGLMGRMRQCAGETAGNASTILMLRSDGTVASAAVAGPPLGGGTIGACLEGVLRSAQFPAFRQQTFRVQYPISIRPLTP